MKKIFTLVMALMLSVVGLYAENTACSGTDTACAEGSLAQGYNYNISTTVADKVYVSFELLDEKDGVVTYIQNWTGGGLINESGLTYNAETKTATGELGGTYASGDAVTFRVKFAFAGGMSVTRNFDFTVGDCKNTAASEAEADAQATTYKYVENGKVIIVTPAGKFNLLGESVE